jgi:hypothetical protein
MEKEEVRDFLPSGSTFLNVDDIGLGLAELSS